jgi:hypothetical protein
MLTSIRNHCDFLANSLGEFENTEPSLGVPLRVAPKHRFPENRLPEHRVLKHRLSKTST